MSILDLYRFLYSEVLDSFLSIATILRLGTSTTVPIKDDFIADLKSLLRLPKEGLTLLNLGPAFFNFKSEKRALRA